MAYGLRVSFLINVKKMEADAVRCPLHESVLKGDKVKFKKLVGSEDKAIQDKHGTFIAFIFINCLLANVPIWEQ
jgi:hypothetical protein